MARLTVEREIEVKVNMEGLDHPQLLLEAPYSQIERDFNMCYRDNRVAITYTNLDWEGLFDGEEEYENYIEGSLEKQGCVIKGNVLVRVNAKKYESLVDVVVEKYISYLEKVLVLYANIEYAQLQLSHETTIEAVQQLRSRKCTSENVYKALMKDDKARKIIQDMFYNYADCADYLIEHESFISFCEPDGCSWDIVREKLTYIAVLEATGHVYMNLYESEMTESEIEAVKGGVSKFIETYSIETEDAADHKELIEKKINEIKANLANGIEIKVSEWKTPMEMLEALEEKLRLELGNL